MPSTFRIILSMRGSLPIQMSITERTNPHGSTQKISKEIQPKLYSHLSINGRSVWYGLAAN